MNCTTLKLFRYRCKNILMFYTVATRHCRRKQHVFALSRWNVRPFVRLFVRIDIILLPRYLMNVLNKFDKNERQYLLVHTDDLVRFWMSSVKGQGHRHPRQRRNVEVHLQVFIFCEIASRFYLFTFSSILSTFLFEKALSK